MRQRNFFDIFFSLSLMSVFVLCSTLLLFFQIDQFQQQKASNEEQENNRLAQSYVTMNFHQRSETSNVSLQEIMGVDCLIINDDVDKTSKLIYVYDGYLREIYQSQQANIDLAIGDKITTVKDMQIEKDENLYTIDMEFEHSSNQIKLSTY